MRATPEVTVDPLVFGARLRHARRRRDMTLKQLGEVVGKPAPYLSMLENGRREPRLSVITSLAAALEVDPGDLLRPDPPDRRSALEITLERMQHRPGFEELGLPYVRPSARLSDEVLEHLVGLYEELERRSEMRSATPEEARRANAELRRRMRAQDNYAAEIEQLAGTVLEAAGYPGSGPVSQHTLNGIAAHFGFHIHHAHDVPASVRSVTDLRNRRIYIPQRDALRTRAARSVILQTLGHFALDHRDPIDFGDFLRQRVEANYFAGAVLAPEEPAVAFLRSAQEDRDLSVEDLKEVFYISYEMAAHRFTNLATRHLGMAVHFVRSDRQGIIWKAYENNGVPFPADADGALEGQRLCREWGTRQAFGSEDQFSIHYQYTDTPAGTFWCGTHVEVDRAPAHAITVGVRFDDARWFRGRDTERHSASRCPEGPCCRQPPPDLTDRWSGLAWPSARGHSHVLAALPAGTFPGVDLTEVYEFLERHSPSNPEAPSG